MPIFYCNRCSHQLSVSSVPPSANLTFSNGARGLSTAISAKSYITNCKHMLCQNCKEKYKSVCARCGKQCSFMQINENMHPSARAFVEPVVQQITCFQKKIGSVRQFQHEQNQWRRYNLKDSKRKYEQAAINEKAITKKATHNLNVARTLNAKLKYIGRMEASNRKRRLITKPNVQHQRAPNGFMQDRHHMQDHNRMDQTPSYQSGSYGFHEKEFTKQHYTHAPFTPSASSLNSGFVNQMHSSRPLRQFIHSTPLS